MARVAGARVAGARAAWRLAGLDAFRTAAAFWAKRRTKGRFDLPSVRVRDMDGTKNRPLAATLSYLAPPLHIA